MTRLFSTIALLTTLGVAACSGPDPTAPTLEPDTGSADKVRGGGQPIGQYLHANKEALGRQTFQNAYKLERAVWRFAADNNGRIPDILGDMNLAGKRLVDYLPGKQQLINAFTRARSEPGDVAASAKGQVGYQTIWDNLGYLIGFRITAMGAGTHQYLQFDRYMAKEDIYPNAHR